MWCVGILNTWQKLHSSRKNYRPTFKRGGGVRKHVISMKWLHVIASTTAVTVPTEFSPAPVQGVWTCSRIATWACCVIPNVQVVFRLRPLLRVTCRNPESLLAPDVLGMRFFQTRERKASFRLNPESINYQRFYETGVHKRHGWSLKPLDAAIPKYESVRSYTTGWGWGRNSKEWSLTRIRTKSELRRTDTVTSILSMCKAVWFATNKNKK